MCKNFIIPYLYKAQRVLGKTPPIIRSLKLHLQPLAFHKWKVVRRVVVGRCQAQCAWQRPPATRPTTFHVWKARGCQCSFRLLMMGGVSLETCWTSYKYRIIKFCYTVASCWIFLYELPRIVISNVVIAWRLQFPAAEPVCWPCSNLFLWDEVKEQTSLFSLSFGSPCLNLTHRPPCVRMQKKIAAIYSLSPLPLPYSCQSVAWHTEKENSFEVTLQLLHNLGRHP
jgi:hypothetical protein